MPNPLEGLTSGNNTHGGSSPRKELAKRKNAEKSIALEVASMAIAKGLKATQEQYHLSESAVVKFCINRAKRDNLDLSTLLPIDKQNELEELILETHTTSIKKLLMVAAGRFSEGELRLERAIMQRQESEQWEY